MFMVCGWLSEGGGTNVRANGPTLDLGVDGVAQNGLDMQ